MYPYTFVYVRTKAAETNRLQHSGLAFEKVIWDFTRLSELQLPFYANPAGY
ncbi:hypothetical protein AT05_09005 [Schleiferia thermophila str. Yellowstone]|nr:hypothetical protein AT05_09005 [Schleiferia thermophila str. Yellowstone]